MIPQITNIKHYKESITFDLENCNPSLSNALRRLIITEIPTVSFETNDYINSSLKVIENTSSLTNELLLQRLGLIPIYFNDIKTYDPEKYKFILDIQNKGQEIIDVTTKHFKIINLETNKEEDNNTFFKVNEITKDPLLLIRLKPSPNNDGEKVLIEGKSAIGIGKTHIRYSPVSNVCFINKKDPQKVQMALDKYLIEKKDTGTTDSLKKTFMLEEADFHYYTNENDDPNMFEFTIESCGVLEPMKILLEAIRQLKNKIILFNEELNKTLSNKDSTIKIKTAESIMESTDIFIHEENHTLGYILQSYIYETTKSSEKDIFIGYMNPHPLENLIKLRINLTDINQIKTILKTTTEHIIYICDSLTSNIMPKSNIDQTKQKPKSKLKFIVKSKVTPPS